jgi:hypothetical protein
MIWWWVLGWFQERRRETVKAIHDLQWLVFRERKRVGGWERERERERERHLSI